MSDGLPSRAEESAAESSRDARRAPNWRHVAVFLCLTFGLTWLLDLLIFLHGGLARPGTVTALQLQMLLPAFSAIVLGLFFFRESPLYHRRSAGRGRWFYRYFLLLTALFALCVAAQWFLKGPSVIPAVAGVTQVVAFLGFALLIVLRLVCGRAEMDRVGLTWGSWRFYLVIGLGVVAFYALQVLLNALAGLGPAHLGVVRTPPGMGRTAAVMTAGVQSVLLAPFLAIAIAFGEEYGWRGYLQRELLKMGRVRGVLLVGVIWGVWHWPLILMGFSYPGYPLIGLLLATLFLSGFAVVLGFAVLRSGSILLAAYLHALNDQTTGYIVWLGFAPHNPVFSFGVGVYGVASLAIVALLLLRGPVWRRATAEPA